MESEDKICNQCEHFRLELIERENEIQILKMHIQNLTNYLLWKDNDTNNISDVTSDTKADLNMLNEVAVKQKFYFSELFITSYNILNKCVIQESKATQTEIIENPGSLDIEDNNKTTKSEVGNSHDYVYDENYKMYYSLSTGYFYDEKSGLMYEPQSCTYYRYNYDKNEYEKVPHGEPSNLESEWDGTKDREEMSYNCEAVVDQVNNLNLNDDPNEVEKSHFEIKSNSTLESKSLAEEPEDENCNNIDLKISEEEDVSLHCAKEWQPTEGSKLTVTDIVKQVVDEHNNMSDYVYDDTYQMYYSPSTGYFYDSIRNLLYDPSSGIYYFYDADKQTYEFYCQTDPNVIDKSKTESQQESINKDRLACRKLYWKKKLKEYSERDSKQSETLNCVEKYDEEVESKDTEEFSSPEDGEIFSSDEEDSSSPICIVKSPIKGPCLNNQKSSKELYPPSIRAIVENSENLQIGSLVLITCSGGIIGRDKLNAIYIPDLCISKLHAEIKYNNDFQTYSIEDLGSQNGTFINEKRLSEPKVKSEPCTLNHGDKLALGSCKLLLHIHDGHDTCDNCEPGQVLAEISSNIENNAVFISKEEKEKLRREELRRLKQKYGLQRSNFERKALLSHGYEDKSEIRRQTVGSDNPYEKSPAPASLDIAMAETNKGYQMLKKMGWKEGQTLGTTESGLMEPIPLQFWTSKAGLGSSYGSSSSLQDAKRTQKWVKAQERYFQLSLSNDASQETDHPTS